MSVDLSSVKEEEREDKPSFSQMMSQSVTLHSTPIIYLKMFPDGHCEEIHRPIVRPYTWQIREREEEDAEEETRTPKLRPSYLVTDPETIHSSSSSSLRKKKKKKTKKSRAFEWLRTQEWLRSMLTDILSSDDTRLEACMQAFSIHMLSLSTEEIYDAAQTFYQLCASELFVSKVLFT